MRKIYDIVEEFHSIILTGHSLPFYQEDDVKEMIKLYTIDIVEEIFQNLDKYILSTQVSWVQVERLKQQIEDKNDE